MPVQAVDAPAPVTGAGKGAKDLTVPLTVTLNDNGESQTFNNNLALNPANEQPAAVPDAAATAASLKKRKKGAVTKKGSAPDRRQTTSNQSNSRSKKRLREEEVTYDPGADYAKPLPVGLKMYCLHYSTKKYHLVKVLEKRPVSQNVQSQSFVRSMADVGGIDALPAPLALHVASLASHGYCYYIHYDGWDRRMDEWTTRDRLLLRDQAEALSAVNQSITMKAPAKPADDQTMTDENETNAQGGNQSNNQTLNPDELPPPVDAGLITGSPSPPPLDSLLLPSSLVAVDHAAAHSHGSMHGNFTEEDLKAHEEATKVKNVDLIAFGPYMIETWYYSPLPPEYAPFSTLHFCEYCLSFFGFESELQRHSRFCTLRHPPGYEIYRSEEADGTIVSAFEVDGAREIIYCQNLCYLAKLFLDHKTLEFDATPFLFYVVCETRADSNSGFHIVGYFSKEKVSTAGYNLACILTLPCHQRKGVGKFLISLSYELSKVERKVGSPEKPISDLGKVSYMSYWTETLLNLFQQRLANKPRPDLNFLFSQTQSLNPVHNNQFNQNNNQTQPDGTVSMVPSVESMACDFLSIDELSKITCFTSEDIIECLKACQVLVWYRSRWCFSESTIKRILQERDEKEQTKLKKQQEKRSRGEIVQYQAFTYCRPEKLHWTPFIIKN